MKMLQRIVQIACGAGIAVFAITLLLTAWDGSVSVDHAGRSLDIPDDRPCPTCQGKQRLRIPNPGEWVYECRSCGRKDWLK